SSSCPSSWVHGLYSFSWYGSVGAGQVGPHLPAQFRLCLLGFIAFRHYDHAGGNSRDIKPDKSTLATFFPPESWKYTRHQLR
ncbi:hypothetical protein, partial [Xanthomonas campestris]